MTIFGHNKQKKYFEHIIQNSFLAHAYLFSGPEMIGKKTFALWLAGTVLGDDLDKKPDFKLITTEIEEGGSKIHIKDIRDLKRFFSLKAYSGSCRMVILDDAHCLTGEASNALLKTLEEPSAGSVIILVSSVPGLLLPTIVSRCENVRFTGPAEKEVNLYLAGKKLKREDREFLAKLAGGRIGLIERLISGDGIREARKAVDDLRRLLNSGVFERMDYAKKVHEKDGYQPRVGYWLNWVSAHVASSPKNEKIVKDLLSLSNLISQSQFNHRLALENFLLNL